MPSTASRSERSASGNDNDVGDGAGAVSSTSTSESPRWRKISLARSSPTETSRIAPIVVRMLAEPRSGRVLGAQIVGEEGAAALIDPRRKVSWPAFPSLRGKPLPGRVNIVITRQQNYQPEGVLVVHDVFPDSHVTIDDTIVEHGSTYQFTY